MLVDGECMLCGVIARHVGLIWSTVGFFYHFFRWVRLLEVVDSGRKWVVFECVASCEVESVEN